jgi:hypothetical protein
MVRILFGLMFGLAATSAWSQNAVVGRQLYLNTNGSPLSCGTGACHSADPTLKVRGIEKGTTAAAILNAIASKNEMKFLASAPYTVSAQQAADIAAFIVNPAAANGASISLSGTTLAFASTQIAVANSTSTPATITLTNSGGGPLTITGIGKTGTNAAEFTATGTCVGASVTVAASGTCTIGASFSPTAVGNRTATFTLQSNAASNPSITLTGTATASAVPSISRSVTAITYNTQTVGATSAARPVTMTNTSTVTVAITAVTATPTPEFAATGNCVGNLAAGASCTMNVTFTPSAAGNRTGNLTITSNATGSPHAVTLAGPGTTTPTGAATLDASAVSFPSTGAGASANPLKTTLTNTGNAPLTIFAVAIGGANAQDFKLGAGTTCVAGALPVNATCQVETEFKPLSAGSKTANAVISHSAGTTTIALGGMANAATTTVAGTSPAPAPTSSSALAPSNLGGGGALNPWVGLLVLLPALLLRRRPIPALTAR